MKNGKIEEFSKLFPKGQLDKPIKTKQHNKNIDEDLKTVSVVNLRGLDDPDRNFIKDGWTLMQWAVIMGLEDHVEVLLKGKVNRQNLILRKPS